MCTRTMLALLPILGTCLWGADPSLPTVPDPTATYHLTFDDEFNAYHADRWQTSDFWDMRNNPGDFQAQWFCDPQGVPKEFPGSPYQPFVASVSPVTSEGTLKIVARPTPANVYSGPDRLPYVSGQLSSAHKFTQRYGYFELRARLPQGKGLWSRFWLLTDDGNWPGEYDVFEVHGKDTTQLHQATHFRDAQHPHDLEVGHYRGINPVDGEFHTYGFLWEKTGVIWYVDGIESHRQINRIDIPMYVLIDLAVGNDPKNLWPGDPDVSTPWPSAMELDYYRVYSNDPGLPSVVPDAGYTPSTLPQGYRIETTPTVAPLPPGWSAGDIGTSGVTGSSTWNRITGEWIVKGSGYDNQCQFAGAPLPGDGTLTATLAGVTAMNRNEVRAGLSFRAGEAVDDPEISLSVLIAYDTPRLVRRVVLQSRGKHPTIDVASVVVGEGPITLRLTRSGGQCAGSYSTNGGGTWLALGTPQTVAMPGAVRAGLAVGGNQLNNQRLSRAFFSSVSLVQP